VHTRKACGELEAAVMDARQVQVMKHCGQHKGADASCQCHLRCVFESPEPRERELCQHESGYCKRCSDAQVDLAGVVSRVLQLRLDVFDPGGNLRFGQLTRYRRHTEFDACPLVRSDWSSRQPSLADPENVDQS
jgi:hypothetical protein